VDQSPNSSTLSRGVRVEAAAQYLPAESDPERRRHLYVYRIRVLNDTDEAVRLVRRHWVILDAHNNREEVVGEGVVGKKPRLGPGEMFEYKSYCPLRTEWGTMEGEYTFHTDDGGSFEAEIGRFFLVPSVDNALVPK